MQTLGLNQQLNVSTWQQKYSGMVAESVNLCIQHMDNQKHLTGAQIGQHGSTNPTSNQLVPHRGKEPLQWIVCTEKSSAGTRQPSGISCQAPLLRGPQGAGQLHFSRLWYPNKHVGNSSSVSLVILVISEQQNITCHFN